MILRRLTYNLRNQNWTAITIEFMLVVLGVFFGILVANWNVGRVEKQETGRLLSQFDSELAIVLHNLDSINAYYAVSGRYATRALAGWRGNPSVSDSGFVIAAYQAGQMRSLRLLMTFDYGLVNLTAAMSRYREEVRKVIPDNLQRAIRAQCGDVQKPGGVLVLPATCILRLPLVDAARTATLRNYAGVLSRRID